MKAVLVDFDTVVGRDFSRIHPIGLFLETPEGGIEMRWRTVFEDGEADSDNYLRTLKAVESWLEGWRSGSLPEGAPTARQMLTYLADQSYLGTRYRSISMLEDDVSLEEAFKRFVVHEEPLPVVADAELSDV